MEHMLIYEPELYLVVMGFLILMGITWLAALGAVVSRNDLPASERTFWLLVVVLVPGLGAVLYWMGGPIADRR